MIAVVDYGAGNINSVIKALDYIGCPAQLATQPAQLAAADGVLLPGVGAFGDAMGALERSGLSHAVKESIASGKPFLGICLGMQVLFERSEERPGVAGLGVFKGSIRRIPSGDGLKVPHIGWNSLEYNTSCPIFAGLGSSPYVYFVHGYYLQAEDESIVSATTEYGVHIHAAVWKGNCFATQFHPEKSGDTGLNILRGFAGLCR